MAHINLLPWRSEERERKNRDFISWLVLALIAAAAVAFFVWYLFNAALENQRQANDLIEVENTKLDVKLEQIADLEVRREAIISRMKVVQDLQGRRPVPVHVWHDVARAVPEAMYLNSFGRKGEVLTFTGRAANPNIVSNLVTNLDASPWMQGAAVSTITQDSVSAYADNTRSFNDARPEDNYVTFKVTTSLAAALPSDEKEGDAVAQNTVSDDTVSANTQENLAESGFENYDVNSDINPDNNTDADINNSTASAENLAPNESVAPNENFTPNNSMNADQTTSNQTSSTNIVDNTVNSGVAVDSNTDFDNNSNINLDDDEINNIDDSPMIQDNSIQGNPSIEGQSSGEST